MLDKAALRTVMRARRDGIEPPDVMTLNWHVMPLCPAGAAVAGYWPIGSEIDIGSLLTALALRGNRVLLPETPEPGGILRFWHWWPGVTMLPERFGTSRPDSVLGGQPDMLLVPLLAFDRGCNRLGYGGGFYDRTIAALPGVRTVGCAYAAQQVDAVPVLPHDVPLDAVATERGVILRPET